MAGWTPAVAFASRSGPGNTKTVPGDGLKFAAMPTETMSGDPSRRVTRRQQRPGWVPYRSPFRVRRRHPARSLEPVRRIPDRRSRRDLDGESAVAPRPHDRHSCRGPRNSHRGLGTRLHGPARAERCARSLERSFRVVDELDAKDGGRDPEEASERCCQSVCGPFARIARIAVARRPGHGCVKSGEEWACLEAREDLARTVDRRADLRIGWPKQMRHVEPDHGLIPVQAEIVPGRDGLAVQPDGVGLASVQGGDSGPRGRPR